MKKVLHIRIDSPHYSSDGIQKGWEQNGFEYIPFNWQEWRFALGTELMQAKAIQLAKIEAPDLIFLHIQNPDAFSVESIAKLSEIAPVINYTFDTRDDISWYIEASPYVKMSVFPSIGEAWVVRDDAQGIQAMYLPSSADFDFYRPGAAVIDFGEIIFIGNNYVGTNLKFPEAEQREEMVKFLYDTYGSRFKAWGRGWNKDGVGSLVLDNKMEREAYRNCKIAITHNNFIRDGYCSDRSWRATGTGAFTIHHNFSGVRDLFGYGEMTAVWTDFNDLKYSIDWFLAHDKDRLLGSTMTMNHVVRNHNWTKRIESILNNMQ